MVRRKFLSDGTDAQKKEFAPYSLLCDVTSYVVLIGLLYKLKGRFDTQSCIFI